MTMAYQAGPAEPEGCCAEHSSNHPPAARVLAVDDDYAACKLLSLILSPPAFYCTTARSGEEALVKLQKQPFDAVISDLDMPGMGGIELLTRVRQEFPRMAFLVTTGVDDLDVGVRAMRDGADDYLVKPLQEGAVAASGSNKRSRTTACIWKKWSQSAPDNCGQHSSTSRTVTKPRCKRWVRRLIYATTRQQVIHSVSAAIRSRLPE
jgi:CheY-like chemotaxis protein